MLGPDRVRWRPQPTFAGKKGFLILGPHRSGTSLTARILNEHPSIAVPPESLFFNTLVPMRRYYGDLALRRNLQRLIDDVLSMPKITEWSPAPTRAQILAHLAEPSLGGVFTALLAAWTQAQDKPRWGEKTPHHVLFWNDIRVALPDVPVLIVLRDGRDVALSQCAARFGPKSIDRAAKRWVRWIEAIEHIKAGLPAHRVHVMHYEDLITDAPSTLTKICHFLGEEFHPELLSFHESAVTYSSYSQEHANLQRPLMRGNLRKWRTMMRPRELAVHQDIAGPALERCGYQLDRERAKANRLERFYERWVAEAVRKPIALLRNRIGHREEFRLLTLRLRLILDYHLGRVGAAPKEPITSPPAARPKHARPDPARAQPMRPYR